MPLSAAAPVRGPEREARLSQQLSGCCFGGAVQAFQSCASTMELAHAWAREGAGEGALVWAARQTQGRGRHGRVWESPEGGAYLSLILRPTRGAHESPQLALVAGLAVAEAMYGLTRQSPSIRWPNDVLLDGNKVCGVLIEAKNGAVIVGIGINVTTPLRELPETATSLALTHAASGVQSSEWISQLTGALCRCFQASYERWTREGFAPIRQALRPWMGHFGQPVQVTMGAQRIEGIAHDLDESGRLLVRLDAGLLRAFEMGEVTLLRSVAR